MKAVKTNYFLTTLLAVAIFTALPYMVKAQSPHPILRYFTGNVDDDQVRLNWVITGGNTCAGIRIQRSADGQFFSEIGEIDGICGSPDVDVPYVFVDPQPLENTINYYRLELGTQGYSTALQVEYIPLNEKGYSLKYDVISRRAVVYFENPMNNIVEYSLLSLSGHRVMEGYSSGSQVQLDLSVYTRQIFILRVFVAGREISVKVPAF